MRVVLLDGQGSYHVPHIQANGIKLEVELRGLEDARPLVLVSGLGRQIVHWSEDLLERLVEAGHRVTPE